MLPPKENVFNYKPNQPIVWFNRSLERSNHYCLYCGKYIGPNSGTKSNKEHLIARQFVPSHYFRSTDFNFIFRCCIDCNSRKSNLERHLSTTTLLNCDSREVDDIINNLALNKGRKDYHPDELGKLAIDSNVETAIEFGNAGMKFGIGFVAPPQSKESYVEELSYRHIQGLFSLMTSSNPCSCEGTNLLPFENFHILGIYPKNDWGNPQIDYFIEETKSWMTCCNISVADGFFKALLIRSDNIDHGWFWALEWNKSLRILGSLVSNERHLDIFSNTPDLNWSSWANDSTGHFRSRREISLTGPDFLFRDNKL